MRLARIAGLVAGVNGLQTNDAPVALHGSRVMTGSASALDPELTNIAGEKFHVTTAGEFVMIGLPDGSCNPEAPGACPLIFTANFDRLENDGPCNDLMIRNVSIQGTKLASGASGVTSVEFSILSDVGNSSDALGFQINGEYKTPEEFSSQLAYCTVSQERGYFQWPTKRTYRFRTTTYNVECGLDFGNHELKLHFSTAWRGTSLDTGLPVYANDMSFSISSVGTDAIGLLGTDDNSAVTVAVPGCNKKQPVSGPYQVRHGPKFPKRHHWR